MSTILPSPGGGGSRSGAIISTLRKNKRGRNFAPMGLWARMTIQD